MHDIFLATGLIQQGDLFNNGLHQNSLTVYSMLEGLGYRCYCIVEKKGPFVPGYRFLEPEDYLQNEANFSVVAYIEMGLSLDSAWREFLRRKGCKVVKLYFGNILNIDTETVCCTPGLYFPHHNAGSIDEVWTSPHYATNLSYAKALNRVEVGRLIPYVWSNQWISHLGRWTAPDNWTFADLVIMEPNISFQKCSLFPILLVKAFAQAYPEWKGRLIVQNSDRLFQNPWFRDCIVPQLTMPVVWKERQTLAEILLANPSATFISHQITNDYNYLVLELMHLGYPLLHNSKQWAPYGYTWSETRWSESLTTLRRVLETHKESQKVYQHHANQLAWFHSAHNPLNQEGWTSLIRI